MKKLLALAALIPSCAFAQTPNGTINAPIYATGYISQVGGTNVTTSIPPQPNHPTNLNIYTTGTVSGTWSIKLPNPPFEGQVLSFMCGAPAGAVSVTSSDGSTVDSGLPSSCAAGTNFAIQFDARSNIWRALFTNTITSTNVPAFTGGDCTSSSGSVVLTCTKTNGVPFAASATTDTTKVYNVVNATPRAENNTVLSALASTYSTSVIRLGYASPGDAPAVVYTPSGSPCTLNAGAGDGGSQIPTSDSKCWIGQITTVDNRIWGAKNDGATDDTTANQRAINYAITDATSAKPVYIGGLSLVSSSLIVNRAVGTTKNTLKFLPSGKNAGFLVNSAITIFDTTLPYPTDPSSEDIEFDGITFQAASNALIAYVISPGFLRVTFNNVVFNAIRLTTTANYLQSWTINGGSVNGAAGRFITADIAYALRITNVDFETNYDGISLSVAQGVTLIGNIFESGNRFFYTHYANGVTAVGNYFEANTSNDLVFNDVGYATQSNGIFSYGNTHFKGASSPAYAQVIGNSIGSGGANTTAYGPSATGSFGLYDDTNVLAGRFSSSGDVAIGNVITATGRNLAVQPSLVVLGQQSITAHAGGGQASATQLTGTVNNVTTCGAGGTDSVKLPPSPGFASAPYVSAIITISNQCAHAIQVFGSGSDFINNSPAATGVSQASGTVVMYINDAGGEWWTK